MIADYTFYQESYHGNKLNQADFDRLIVRAGYYLQSITGGRAESQADNPAVKMAACAVAEVYANEDDGGAVASETVGEWSRTYAGSGKTLDRRLYDVAALYLSGTDLLARWC